MVTANMAVVRILSWQVIWYVATSRLLAATYSRLFWIRYTAEGTITFTVSMGCLMMVRSRALHHLATLLSSSFQTRPRQVMSLTSSAMKTAVVEMNMSPGLVLAYLMLSPNMAFCPVSVTRLIYFNV